jgi:hypothetical protein
MSILQSEKEKNSMKEQLLEKFLWLFIYNTGGYQASHVKLFYALDLEDAEAQVQCFINTTDHMVNEELLKPMPWGFSIASKSFPGKILICSD